MFVKDESENFEVDKISLSSQLGYSIYLTHDLPNEQLLELRSFVSNKDCYCLAYLAEIIQKIRYLAEYLSNFDEQNCSPEAHKLLLSKMIEIEQRAIHTLFLVAKSTNAID